MRGNPLDLKGLANTPLFSLRVLVKHKGGIEALLVWRAVTVQILHA